MSFSLDNVPHFSPEYQHRRNAAGRSLKESLESGADGLGIREYLREIQRDLADTEAYNSLIGICADLERVFPPGTRIADAFHDGGAIAIDCSNLFLPHLVKPLGTLIERDLAAIRSKVRAFTPFARDLPAMEYADAIRADGRANYERHAGNHSSVLDDVCLAKRYGGSANLALRQGFGFVMERTALAYAADREQAMAESCWLERETDRSLAGSPDPDRVSTEERVWTTHFDWQIEQFFAERADETE